MKNKDPTCRLTVSMGPSGIRTCPSQPCRGFRPISNVQSLSRRIIRNPTHCHPRWGKLSSDDLDRPWHYPAHGESKCVHAVRVRAAASPLPCPLLPRSGDCRACLRVTPACFPCCPGAFVRRSVYTAACQRSPRAASTRLSPTFLRSILLNPH